MPTRIQTIQYQAGRLVVIDANNRAIPAGELVDCSVSFDAEDKELPSEDQVAQLSIRTALKCTVKAKIQRVVSNALQAAVLGGSVSTGAKEVIEKESVTISAGSGTVANGATFSDDLGVLDSTGKPMEPVASAPTLGQYVEGAAGVGTYTFNASEVSPVKITYLKTTTGGEIVTVDNQTQGASPTLAGWFFGGSLQPDGTTKKVADYFYKLVPSKLSKAQKRGDFADSDIELMAIANSLGKFYESHRA